LTQRRTGCWGLRAAFSRYILPDSCQPAERRLSDPLHTLVPR